MLEKMDETAKEFSNTLNQLAVAIDGDVEKVIRLGVLKVFANIVKRSPVLTGAYRASHSIADHEPGKEEGIAEKGTGETEVIRKSQGWRWKVEDGDIYIFNNVPYAERLEDGWSTQAPQGIYALALSEFSQIFQQELEKIGRLK